MRKTHTAAAFVFVFEFLITTCALYNDFKMKVRGAEHMLTRRDVVSYCMTLPAVYEDHPFKDTNWTLMRHLRGKRTFAFVFEREGMIWVNVKNDPEEKYYWLENFSSIIPGYHMNKKYWLSVILDGTIPEDAIKSMIAISYALTREK